MDERAVAKCASAGKFARRLRRAGLRFCGIDSEFIAEFAMGHAVVERAGVLRPDMRSTRAAFIAWQDQQPPELIVPTLKNVLLAVNPVGTVLSPVTASLMVLELTLLSAPQLS